MLLICVRHCVKCWGHSRKTQHLLTRRLKPRRRRKKAEAGAQSEGLRAGAERRGGSHRSEKVSEAGHTPAHDRLAIRTLLYDTLLDLKTGGLVYLPHTPRTISCHGDVCVVSGTPLPGPALTVGRVTASSSSHPPLSPFLHKHGPLMPGCLPQAKVGARPALILRTQAPGSAHTISARVGTKGWWWHPL